MVQAASSWSGQAGGSSPCALPYSKQIMSRLGWTCRTHPQGRVKASAPLQCNLLSILMPEYSSDRRWTAGRVVWRRENTIRRGNDCFSRRTIPTQFHFVRECAEFVPYPCMFIQTRTGFWRLAVLYYFMLQRNHLMVGLYYYVDHMFLTPHLLLFWNLD